MVLAIGDGSINSIMLGKPVTEIAILLNLGYTDQWGNAAPVEFAWLSDSVTFGPLVILPANALMVAVKLV